MNRDCLPSQVVNFIRDYIESVEQLEILLLLAQYPDRDWSPEEVAKELRGSSLSAQKRLEEFASKGIFSERVESSRRYAFQPEHQETKDIVAELAELYHIRRVSVIDHIFSKPIQKIKVFADAFKLRGDK